VLKITKIPDSSQKSSQTKIRIFVTNEQHKKTGFLGEKQVSFAAFGVFFS